MLCICEAVYLIMEDKVLVTPASPQPKSPRQLVDDVFAVISYFDSSQTED